MAPLWSDCSVRLWSTLWELTAVSLGLQTCLGIHGLGEVFNHTDMSGAGGPESCLFQCAWSCSPLPYSSPFSSRSGCRVVLREEWCGQSLCLVLQSPNTQRDQQPPLHLACQIQGEQAWFLLWLLETGAVLLGEYPLLPFNGFFSSQKLAYARCKMFVWLQAIS